MSMTSMSSPSNLSSCRSPLSPSSSPTPSTSSLMRFESHRLATFTSWPSNAAVDARKIAKAGFFYTERLDAVQCHFCGCILQHWQYGDQVMARHREASPNCPFVRNASDNVALSSLSASSSLVANNADEVMEEPVHLGSVMIGNNTNENNGVNENRLREEQQRLNTFTNWPLTFISPEQLARSGFVYTGRRDCVRCVFCGEYVGEWDRCDDPDREHRTLFPHCPFVRGEDVGNIPIQNATSAPTRGAAASTSSSSSSASSEESMGYDVTGIRRRDMHSGPEKGLGTAFWNALSTKDNTSSLLENSRVIRHSGPAHAKYSTVDARLKTFRDWPPALRQQPKELAEAGFYYIGLSDQVKCFYCDGGLRNWQPSDEPWVEHARWFSRCGFVRLVKGDDFIDECVRGIDENPSNNSVNNSGGTAQNGDDESARMKIEERLGETSVKPSEEALKPPSSSQAPSTSSATSSSSAPSTSQSTSLELENRRLKEARMCKICMDKEIGVVFVPCGHFVSCVQCAPSLKDCPICRQPIHVTVKTYMP